MAEVICACCGKSVLKGYCRCFKLDGSFKYVCYDCYTKNGYLQKGYEEREEVTTTKKQCNERQDMATCECCGERIRRSRCKNVHTKQGNKNLCSKCLNDRYCEVCKKLDTNHTESFEKINGHNVCSQCIQDTMDLCKKAIKGVMEYIKDFYSEEKLMPYYSIVNSDNTLEDFIRKKENLKLVSEFVVNPEPSKGSIFFRLFKRLICQKSGNLDGFDNENALAAHWNDFLASSQDLPRKFFPFEYVAVGGACKHCGRSIFIENGPNKKFYVFFDKEKVYDTAYNLYLRVKNDPNYKCQHCIDWLDIIDSLRKKFGWNPKWKVALNEFEKFGKRSHGQADPNDFYRILTANEIVMSQQVVDAWNAIYERRNGNCIIKCYAVPDSVRGQIEQGINRAAGGLLKKLFG